MDTSDFTEDDLTPPVSSRGLPAVRVSAVRSDPPGLPPPASFSVFALGATEIRNLATLRQRDDWALWEPAVRKELEYAITIKSALTYRTHAQMRVARRDYPDVFEILHLVTPCVVKHDADGNMSRRKFRVTVADDRGRPNSKFAAETYSGAIDGATVRYLANLTLGRNGKRRYLDVQAAYFNGRKPHPGEPGGRSIWVPVPAGWDAFGYRSHADDGSRNWRGDRQRSRPSRRRAHLGQRLRRLPSERGFRAICRG